MVVVVRQEKLLTSRLVTSDWMPRAPVREASQLVMVDLRVLVAASMASRLVRTVVTSRGEEGRLHAAAARTTTE